MAFPDDERDDQDLTAYDPSRPLYTPSGVVTAGAVRPTLSLGQRIGGQTADDTSAPTVSIGQTSDTNVPSAVSRGTDMKMPPAPPANTNIADLMQKRGELGTPINRNQPQYLPGIGTRIARAFGDLTSRGISGAIQGAVNPNAPGYYGRGAVNQKYTIDENKRQADLANVGQQITDQEKLADINEKAYANAVKQAYESQVGSARQATAEAQQQKADVAQQLADLKTQQGPAEPKTETELALAVQMSKMKGDTKKAAAYQAALDALRLQKTGERTPRQPTELETWIDAFRRDNKREPTADEIRDRKAKVRGTPEQFAKVEEKKQQTLATAEKAYRKAVSEALSDEDRKAALDDLNEAKRKAQEAYLAEIDSLQGPAANKTSGNAAPAKQQPVAPPPKPTTPAPAGRVWVYDKKTGQRGTVKKEQFASATQGANAQYGTW